VPVKVFISSSRTESREVALGLCDWVPKTLTFVVPSVSTADIAEGAR
jgi:hypothetical protein